MGRQYCQYSCRKIVGICCGILVGIYVVGQSWENITNPTKGNAMGMIPDFTGIQWIGFLGPGMG